MKINISLLFIIYIVNLFLSISNTSLHKKREILSNMNVKDLNKDNVSFIKPIIVESLEHINYYLEKDKKVGENNMKDKKIDENNKEIKLDSKLLKKEEIKIYNEDKNANEEIKIKEVTKVQEANKIIDENKKESKEIKEIERKENVQKEKEKMKSLEIVKNDLTNIMKIEQKIKELKIQLFGDEKADLSYYNQNKDVYNKTSLKRIQSIVNLLDLVEEYNFMKNGNINKEGNVKERKEEEISIKTSSELSFRKSSNKELTPRNLRIEEYRPLDLKGRPPKSDEKYVALFKHDTVQERNKITINPNLK